MAVFRVEKTKDFTIMSNHHLRNTELSLKAKGLLSLMLSLPEDWDYTTKGLAHICKDGVDSITTALKELERHGYLTRQRLRYDNGQLGDIEYTIHEQPVSTENTGLSPKRENPRQVKPEQAKPKQAEPEQENPAQLNTNLVCKFLVVLSGAVLGILSGIIFLAALVLFFVAGFLPGLAWLMIAFLISPYGLPLAAAWLVGIIGGANSALKDFIFG